MRWAPVDVALLALAVSAGIWDWRWRRIPNWLVAGGLVAGLGAHAWMNGWNGVATAGLGIALATAVYLPLYLLRAVGAGDAKLMMAVGALAGPRNWLTIFLWSALLGGAIALVMIVARRRVRRTFANVGKILSEMLRLRAPHRASAELDVTSDAGLRLPRGCVVALAVACYYAAK